MVEYTYENKLDYSDEEINKLREQEKNDIKKITYQEHGDTKTELIDVHGDKIQIMFGQKKENKLYGVHELISILDKSKEFKNLKDFQNWLNKQIIIEDKIMSEHYKREENHERRNS